jgi:hypothetical protein
MVTPPKAVTRIEHDEMLDEATERLRREVIVKQRAMRAGTVRESEVRKRSETLARAALTQDVARGFALALARIRALEDRLKTIEARGSVEYLGVWQRAASYQRGNLVTCDGAMWAACRDTAAEKPGASDAWQLILKSGR